MAEVNTNCIHEFWSTIVCITCTTLHYSLTGSQQRGYKSDYSILNEFHYALHAILTYGLFKGRIENPQIRQTLSSARRICMQ